MEEEMAIIENAIDEMKKAMSPDAVKEAERISRAYWRKHDIMAGFLYGFTVACILCGALALLFK